MAYKAVVKDELVVGIIYGIDFKEGFAEIYRDTLEKNPFRKFKVTEDRALDLGLGMDKVDKHLVTAYLENMGIIVDESARTALGLTLDRTASSITEEKTPVKNTGTKTAEKSGDNGVSTLLSRNTEQNGNDGGVEVYK